MTESSMPDATAPVFVMRWFRDGSGYAYDPRIDQRSLTAAITCINPVFMLPPGRQFRHAMSDGRVVLGQVEAELHHLDARAEGRRPVVIRAVLLSEPLSECRESTIRQHLGTLPLPTMPGPCSEGLSVPLPRVLVCPEPDFAHSVVGKAKVWLGLGLIFGTEAYLQTQLEPTASLFGWAWRVAALLFVIGLFRWAQLPLATRKELTERERLLDSGEPVRWRELLADSAVLVLPDGSRLTAENQFGSAVSAMPASVSATEYQVVLAYPGMALLQGQERLRMADEREIVCLFVRCYSRIQGHWRLRLAQWVPSARPNMVEPHSPGDHHVSWNPGEGKQCIQNDEL